MIIKFNALPPEFFLQAKEDILGATRGLSKDLDAFTNGNSTPFSLDAGLLKIISALAPWILFSVLVPLVSREGNRSTFTGILLLAIPSAIIGYFLPLYDKTWINYLGFPWGYFTFMIYVVTMWQNRKKP